MARAAQPRESIDTDTGRPVGRELDGARTVSLLYPPCCAVGLRHPLAEPEHFRDLNLHQLIRDLDLEEGDSEIRSVFYGTVAEVGVIRYRQSVFRDLEVPALLAGLRTFKHRLDTIRLNLDRQDRRLSQRQREGLLLDAALTYCRAVDDLRDVLHSEDVKSPALTELRYAVEVYRLSEGFRRLQDDARRVHHALAEIAYCVRVGDGGVEVSRYQGQPDYAQEIEETFCRFRQGDARDYSIEYRTPPALGHVGDRILEFVARLFPGPFSSLTEFARCHGDFFADQIRQVAWELGFYLSYLEYVNPIREAGLALCYPDVVKDSRESAIEDSFDLVLARKLCAEGATVVTNSVHLEGRERILVVSGPNQGGKTTFARAFGQLHHLGQLGCPVPGSSAKIGLFDQIFTHFQREEDLTDLVGKLEDDLVRARDILAAATEASVVILNETFASTTLDDARLLGGRLMKALLHRGVRAVYVTFVDELASLSPEVVSMVSTVEPDDPAKRTFRILRQPADGLAYALAIAEKYGVTYERLRKILER